MGWITFAEQFKKPVLSSVHGSPEFWNRVVQLRGQVTAGSWGGRELDEETDIQGTLSLCQLVCEAFIPTTHFLPHWIKNIYYLKRSADTTWNKEVIVWVFLETVVLKPVYGGEKQSLLIPESSFYISKEKSKPGVYHKWSGDGIQEKKSGKLPPHWRQVISFISGGGPKEEGRLGKNVNRTKTLTGLKDRVPLPLSAQNGR